MLVKFKCLFLYNHCRLIILRWLSGTSPGGFFEMHKGQRLTDFEVGIKRASCRLLSRIRVVLLKRTFEIKIDSWCERNIWLK